MTLEKMNVTPEQLNVLVYRQGTLIAGFVSRDDAEAFVNNAEYDSGDTTFEIIDRALPLK